MKKKLFVMFLTVSVVFSLFGCGVNTLSLVKKNLSEWTKVFYMAECDDFYVTLSSGMREKEYLMNGVAGEMTDFALLSINFVQNPKSEMIFVELSVDEEKIETEMELNPMNDSYMVDFECLLSGDEKISLKYENQSMVLENLSKNFQIDDQKAMQIACDEIGNLILKKKSLGKLNAEIYLRVLDKKSNNFDDIFWCLTALNVDGESFSIVISTVDGSVLAKSK